MENEGQGFAGEDVFSLEDVVDLMRQVAGGDVADLELSATTRFDELDLTSLELAEMFFEVETRLELELDPAGASDPKTLGEMVEWINNMACQDSGGPVR